VYLNLNGGILLFLDFGEAEGEVCGNCPFSIEEYILEFSMYYLNVLKVQGFRVSSNFKMFIIDSSRVLKIIIKADKMQFLLSLREID